MSNEYFRLLIEERWVIKVSHNGGPWTGPEQYGMYPSRLKNIQALQHKLLFRHRPLQKIAQVN